MIISILGLGANNNHVRRKSMNEPAMFVMSKLTGKPVNTRVTPDAINRSLQSHFGDGLLIAWRTKSMCPRKP
jgi:hypothetical protein